MFKYIYIYIFLIYFLKLKVCSFAQHLRIKLWSELLQLKTKEEQAILVDPIIDAVYKDLWQKTSSNNSKYYTKIFDMVPNSCLRTTQCVELSQSSKAGHLEMYQKYVHKIKGYLVNFPVQFLLEVKKNNIYIKCIL